MSTRKDAPPRPTGTGLAAQFFQWVWDQLAAGRFPLIDTPTVKWDRNSGGYAANVVPKGFSGSSSKTLMYPFRIYQAGNIANPTDNWRTFQMRSGAIGFRSKYYLPSSGASVGTGLSVDGGNFENVITDIKGSDEQSYYESPIQPTAASLIEIPSVGAVPITQSGLAQPTQFMLSDLPDDLGYYQAGLWVKITDDKATGLTAQLWGQMFSATPSDHTGRGQSPFPAADPTIVPIGIITCGSYPAGNKIFDSVTQLQFGNLINRYAPTSGDFSSSQISLRGDWDNDNLVGQVFWPGDLVSYQYGTPKVTNLFIHNNSVSVQNNPPTISGNFKLFAKIS